RAHPALTLHRGHRPRGTSRRGALPRHALHRLHGPDVADPRRRGRLRDGQVRRRVRDGVGRVPDVFPRPHGRRAAGGPLRRGRRPWSAGDWLRAVALVFGAVFLVSGVASHHSLELLSVTRYYKHRIVVQGNWAAGALAIGLGVIPLIGGIAALLRAPGEEPSR